MNKISHHHPTLVRLTSLLASAAPPSSNAMKSQWTLARNVPILTGNAVQSTCKLCIFFCLIFVCFILVLNRPSDKRKKQQHLKRKWNRINGRRVHATARKGEIDIVCGCKGQNPLYCIYNMVYIALCDFSFIIIVAGNSFSHFAFNKKKRKQMLCSLCVCICCACIRCCWRTSRLLSTIFVSGSHDFFMYPLHLFYFFGWIFFSVHLL